MHGIHLFYAETADKAYAMLEREFRADIEGYIEQVKPIIENVKQRGWEAVREYTLKFDKVDVVDPRVSREKLREALDTIGEKVRWALEVSIDSVRKYHEAIKPREIVYESMQQGIKIVLKPIPLTRVGVYVPGGAHPYPSSVIMAVVPAKVAGVRHVAITTPPRPFEGFPAHPVILAASYLVGADIAYTIGGAQAIAALAYGARPYVESVDKIVGPGNPYVVTAKYLVSRDVGIDMLAGPSEVMIVASSDTQKHLEQLALDLLAQTEHGALSIGIFATDSRELALNIVDRIALLTKGKSGEFGNIYVFVLDSLEECIAFANIVAPEHLELVGESAIQFIDKVENAGAVAVNTPVALTDFSAGPSHVLPTGGSARWRGGLSTYDFVKLVAVTEVLDLEAVKDLIEAAKILAEVEGFNFHRKSLERFSG
ncbi:MAG TPA: histidinol dehydrogenase [Pyrodictium sp.]|nr:histidinol dehydrogenase [Pyrodictium sp.]